MWSFLKSAFHAFTSFHRFLATLPSDVACDSHEGILLGSPSKKELPFYLQGVQWADNPQLLRPSVSVLAFMQRPCSSWEALCQWLSIAGLQGWGHFCPALTLLLWNLCSGSPHWVGQVFVRNVLPSETLPMHPSSSPLSFHGGQSSTMVWQLPLLSSAGSFIFPLLPSNKPFALLTASRLLWNGRGRSWYITWLDLFFSLPIQS